MKSTGMGALNGFPRRVEKRAFGAEKMTSSAVDDEEGRNKEALGLGGKRHLNRLGFTVSVKLIARRRNDLSAI